MIVEAVDFVINDIFLYHCVLLHRLGQSTVWSEMNGAPEALKQGQQHNAIKAITFQRICSFLELYNLHTTFLHTQEEDNRQQSKCSLSLRIDRRLPREKNMTPDFHQGTLFSILLEHIVISPIGRGLAHLPFVICLHCSFRPLV